MSSGADDHQPKIGKYREPGSAEGPANNSLLQGRKLSQAEVEELAKSREKHFGPMKKKRSYAEGYADGLSTSKARIEALRVWLEAEAKLRQKMGLFDWAGFTSDARKKLDELFKETA